MAKLSSSRQKALLRKYARNVKFLMMLISICLIVFFLPKQAKFSYEYEKGRIWNQKDLVSPYNFAILKTAQENKTDQKATKESITPIYQLDASVENQQVEGFKNDIEIKWHNAGINDKLKPKYVATGTDLLIEIYETGILKLNAQYQLNSENYPITVLNKNIAVRLYHV
jgi:membrane-associated HD superfamily phosphohydrolase